MKQSKQKPTIAITGANGFLGSALVKYFSNKGWHVIALARQDGPAIKNVQFIKYNLEKSIDSKIFKNTDYLVHTAYVKQDKKHPNAFNINVSAAKNLINAATKQKVTRCIFISSMSAHNDAESIYGKQKLAIEKLFSSKRDVVLRSGLIIGNGGIVKQMSDFMKSKHIVPLVGGGQQPLQIIAIYDLVQVIEKALTTKATRCYTVATPEVYTYRQFYQALADSLNLKVLFVPVPFWLLIGGLELITLLHLPLNISKDNALGLKKLKSVDTRRDLSSLGVKLSPLNKALQRSYLT